MCPYHVHYNAHQQMWKSYCNTSEPVFVNDMCVYMPLLYACTRGCICTITLNCIFIIRDDETRCIPNSNPVIAWNKM